MQAQATLSRIREPDIARRTWLGGIWRRFLRQRLAVLASVVLLAILLSALLAPVIAPYDPERIFPEGLGNPLAPNEKFWLGTDGRGRDLLSRLLWGGRISLAVGVTASTVTLCIAVLVGGLAGFSGGRVDYIIMRLVDLMMSIPSFFVILLLVALLKPSPLAVVSVIVLFGWPYPTRVFRSEALSLRRRDFILAAQSLGAPTSMIFVRHLLPHIFPLLVVYLSLSVPSAIFTETTLSYLGLGVPPPTPTWGSMVLDGQPYYRVAPWLVLFPGLAIMLTGVCFNLVGTGLREAIDPVRRER
ncbi:MAG: peptide ABC transporter permease [Candidatus Roseilinea sp.]|nr:MAG: peptide ABC transporter permease [Candidatus Roseilinea sp.]